MHVTRCRVAWPAPANPLLPELLSARLSSSSFSIFSGPEDFTATARLSLNFYTVIFRPILMLCQRGSPSQLWDLPGHRCQSSLGASHELLPSPDSRLR